MAVKPMYLLDSNILIYYLEGQKEIGDFVDSIKPLTFISVVSVTELLAKPQLSKEQINLHDLSLVSKDKIFSRISELKLIN